MKVYILTSVPFPHGMAATNRVLCYAKSLLYAGVDCEVVVFRRTERYGIPHRNLQGCGFFEGIPFRYIGRTIFRNHNPYMRRLLDWRDKFFAIQYLFSSLNRNDKVLLFCRGDLYSIFLIITTKLCRSHVVRDLCELPYGTGNETIKRKLKRIFTLKIQFPLLDGFICISESLLELARIYGSHNAKYIKIPILIDYGRYHLENHSEHHNPYMFHGGTLYEQKDGILGMIEAFGKALPKINTVAKFISTGVIEKSPHKKEINNLIEKYNLKDRLLFTGYLSDESYLDYLSRASFVVINKYDNQQNHFCFSTKLGEYMAAGKPVIITDVGEAMNYLENGKNAVVVPSGDNDALSKAIINALIDLPSLTHIGEEGQKTSHRFFDYRSQCINLAKFLKSLSLH